MDELYSSLLNINECLEALNEFKLMQRLDNSKRKIITILFLTKNNC